MKIFTVVAVSIGIVLVGASCSKADEPVAAPSATSTTVAAPSSIASTTTSRALGSDKGTFIKAGNSICHEMNQKSSALSRTYDQGAKTPTATQKLLDANGDLITGSVNDLRALPQPTGDEAQLEGMYADVEKLASYSHQMATAAGQGDAALVTQLQTEGKQQQTAVNTSFTAYGLVECGQGS